MGVTLWWSDASSDLDLRLLDQYWNYTGIESGSSASSYERMFFVPGDTYYIAEVHGYGVAGVLQPYELWIEGIGVGEFASPDAVGSVRVPGYAPRAITVGAVGDDNQLASFSSHGGGLGSPGVVKPDVVAPGVDIYSTTVENSYVSKQGTSMASPHVAGTAALILDAVGKNAEGEWNFTPEEVKAAIVRGASAEGRAGPPDTAYGSGLVKPSNVIFGHTLPAGYLVYYRIHPRLVGEYYSGNVLAASPALAAAISWEDAGDDLDIFLYDAEGNRIAVSQQRGSSYEKVGGIERAAASYRLVVRSWFDHPVTFTGAATHPISLDTLHAANNQSVSVAEDASTPVYLLSTNPDLDPLTYSVTAGPAHGDVAGVPPYVTYTPHADYSGTDSFMFSASEWGQVRRTRPSLGARRRFRPPPSIPPIVFGARVRWGRGESNETSIARTSSRMGVSSPPLFRKVTNHSTAG